MSEKIIENDSKFHQPQWNAKLWRYMSIDKFFDLLLNNQLYFSNLIKMTDENEAQIPKKNIEELRKSFSDKFNDNDKDRPDFIDFNIDILQRKQSTFVNCWILSPNESYALWKIYLGGEKLGIAIKTNTKKLVDSINSENVFKNDHIYFSKVDYADYLKGEIDIKKLTITKRLPYKYENEARLMVFKEPEFKQSVFSKEQNIINGLKFNINADSLIEEIYLSPFGGNVFKYNFKKLIEKINPSLVSRLRKSEIRDK